MVTKIINATTDLYLFSKIINYGIYDTVADNSVNWFCPPPTPTLYYFSASPPLTPDHELSPSAGGKGYV